MDDLIRTAQQEEDSPQQRAAKSILRQFLECESRIDIDLNEDARSGYFSTVPLLRRRLHRLAEYTMDSLQNNNADKAARDEYFQPRQGNLGTCKKNYPVNKVWTPGMFILTCACKMKTVLAISFMDSGESPRTFFDMIRHAGHQRDWFSQLVRVTFGCNS
jgi:hypothetical protein